MIMTAATHASARLITSYSSPPPLNHPEFIMDSIVPVVSFPAPNPRAGKGLVTVSWLCRRVT